MTAGKHGITTSVKAAVNIDPHRFIHRSGNPCTAGQRALGASIIETNAGQQAAVVMNGIVIIESGAAIALDAAVTSDGVGRATTTGALSGEGALLPGTNGFALDAASGAGKKIRVQLLA